MNFSESGLWGRILSAMKILLTVLFCLSLPLIGADKKPLTKDESAEVIEAVLPKDGATCLFIGHSFFELEIDSLLHRHA